MKTPLSILFVFLSLFGFSQYFPQDRTDTIYPEGVGFRAGITQATKVVPVPTPPSSATLAMTTNAGEGFQVNIYVTFEGDLTVDWGDGSEPEAMENDPGGVQGIANDHVYAVADEYDIVITGDLTGLDTLYCNSDSLTNVTITGLTSLTHLYLHENTSMTSPPDLTGLTSLVELNLSGNTSMTSPPDLTGCTSLVELYLYSNTSMTTAPDLSDCTSLVELYLSGCSFSEAQITTMIGQLPDRTSLDPGFSYFVPQADGYPQTLTETQLGLLDDINWIDGD